jgi:hypothetical protein
VNLKVIVMGILVGVAATIAAPKAYAYGDTCESMKAEVMSVNNISTAIAEIRCDPLQRTVVFYLTDIGWAAYQSGVPGAVSGISQMRAEFTRRIGYTMDVRTATSGVGFQSQTSPLVAQAKFVVQEGVGIGAVHLHQTLDAAIQAWGQPDEQESEKDGAIMYTWNQHPGEINAIVRDGQIDHLFADGPQFRTPSGLVVRQTTQSAVRVLFGEPAKIATSYGRTTWFYWDRGLDVTFKNGIVDYVSVFDPD